jgi:glucan biosynthesis protein
MNHPVDRIVRVAAASLVAALVLAPLRAFNRGEVIRRAQTLAASPYANRASDLSESLRQLTYDEYRMIQFDERRTLWAEEGLPFRVQFFHPGFVHDRTVQVSQLVTGEPLLIPFETGLFRYHGQFRPAHLHGILGSRASAYRTR